MLQAIRKAVKNGKALDLTGWSPSKAVNGFANTTVSSIVLEIPDRVLGSGTIGVWGMTVLATDAGGWRQINRAGIPMIQPIFNPDDSERASEYNTTHPSKDRANYGALVTSLTAGVVSAMGTSADPQAYGKYVAELCFPDILRYEIGTPAVYSFAKRKRPRTVGQCARGDVFRSCSTPRLRTVCTPDAVSRSLRPAFPYLALPVPVAV